MKRKHNAQLTQMRKFILEQLAFITTGEYFKRERKRYLEQFTPVLNCTVTSDL